jgi:signal transduction histidine kinase
MANQKKESVSFSQTLEKISGNAKDTMERMSDIVWAIHPENDSLEQLVIRMKEFAADILEPLDIRYDFNVEGDIGRLRLNINQRRDLYLIFKEALNNAAKYSTCKNVRIKLRQQAGILSMEIADDGKGFDEQSIQPGNGLRNMRQRAKQMGGTLEVISGKETGTNVALTVKS